MFNAVPTYSALPGSSSSDNDDDDVAGGAAVRTPESSLAHLLSADRSETVTAVAALWRDAVTNGRVPRLQLVHVFIPPSEQTSSLTPPQVGGADSMEPRVDFLDESAQPDMDELSEPKPGDNGEQGLDIESIFLKSHPSQCFDSVLEQ